MLLSPSATYIHSIINTYYLFFRTQELGDSPRKEMNYGGGNCLRIDQADKTTWRNIAQNAPVCDKPPTAKQT